MKPIQLNSPTRTFQHGDLKSYFVGFALSTLLTLGAFGAAMSDVVPRGAALDIVVVLCVVQLVVQLVFFLHMGMAADQRANTGVFICTALLITVIVAGSLWVTHNANANMMPTQMSPMRAISKD